MRGGNPSTADVGVFIVDEIGGCTETKPQTYEEQWRRTYWTSEKVDWENLEILEILENSRWILPSICFYPG